jgi:hypothetical protein
MGEAGIADMEERSGESEMIGAALSSMPVVLFSFFLFFVYKTVRTTVFSKPSSIWGE